MKNRNEVKFMQETKNSFSLFFHNVHIEERREDITVACLFYYDKNIDLIIEQLIGILHLQHVISGVCPLFTLV